MTIPIDIREVHRHGGHAQIPQCQPRNGAETFAIFVEPDFVWRVKKIVAHVKVRGSIAVEVTKRDGRAPVQRPGGQTLAILVPKTSPGPRRPAERRAAL